MNKPYPRSFFHIGLSVHDFEKAVKFYTKVSGWYVIMKPMEIIEYNSPIGQMCTDVFGKGWGDLKSHTWPPPIRLELKCLSLPQTKTRKITLNIISL